MSRELGIELSNVTILYNEFSNKTYYYYKQYKQYVNITTMNYHVKNNPIIRPT